jgi:uncharacterized protein YndB with AHSA1/START domain
MSSIDLQGSYEFGPSIVWDALVDPELMAGWLAEAVVNPEIGGAYILTGIPPLESMTFDGRIVSIERPLRLEVSSSSGAALDFTLVEVAGGNRGTSTRLGVHMMSPIEPPVASRMMAASRRRADWLICLDQLDDLLHGHPVDWQHWARDHGLDWARYFGQAGIDPAVDRPGSRRHPHG